MKLEGAQLLDLQYKATRKYNELTKAGKPNTKAGEEYMIFGVGAKNFTTDDKKFVDAYDSGKLALLDLKETESGFEVINWKTIDQMVIAYSNEEVIAKVRGKAAPTVKATLDQLVAP
jgi:hypothetical protein